MNEPSDEDIEVPPTDLTTVEGILNEVKDMLPEGWEVGFDFDEIPAMRLQAEDASADSDRGRMRRYFAFLIQRNRRLESQLTTVKNRAEMAHRSASHHERAFTGAEETIRQLKRQQNGANGKGPYDLAALRNALHQRAEIALNLLAPPTGATRQAIQRELHELAHGVSEVTKRWVETGWARTKAARKPPVVNGPHPSGG
jgi:hypothetical protein